MNQNGDISPSDGSVSIHINGCVQTFSKSTCPSSDPTTSLLLTTVNLSSVTILFSKKQVFHKIKKDSHSTDENHLLKPSMKPSIKHKTIYENHHENHIF